MAFIENYRGAGTQGAGDLQRAVYQKYGQLDPYQNQFATLADDFAAQFKQLVGREPNANEVSSYMSNVSSAGLDAFTQGRGLELQQQAQNYIGSRYADEANQITQSKLQDQTSEASRLADLFRSQGNTAINATEQSLLDYQNKLFERLRPNLITSLQAQGLLNTGGLNQAVVGAQADLANEGAAKVADLRLANEQAANDIAFGGASAPYQYNQAQLMNNANNMQNAASTGLANAYSTFMNQLNFQNQQALMNQQYNLNQAANRRSGGFFKNVGNALAPSLGQSIGTSLGQWLSPQAAKSLATPGTTA